MLGRNDRGQLGDGAMMNSSLPVAVALWQMLAFAPMGFVVRWDRDRPVRLGLAGMLAALGLLGTAGCSHANNCGHRAAPSPAIAVVDAATGQPICDAVVTPVLSGWDGGITVVPSTPADSSTCVFYLEGPPREQVIAAPRCAASRSLRMRAGRLGWISQLSELRSR